MDSQKMGRFILECRKARHMTQKELAENLNITDKAVSKWERGISCPDISTLPALAKLFDVSVGELLNGGQENSDGNHKIQEAEQALAYADFAAKKKIKSWRGICGIVLSALFFIGIVVCAICDVAVFRKFTWSLYPISSILFGWALLLPIFLSGRRGIAGSLLLLSLLLIPYLCVLNALIQNSPLLLPIGIRTAIVSILYLWIIFVLNKYFFKKKIILPAIAADALLAVPLHIAINGILSGLLNESLFDVWDICVIAALAATAFVLLAADYLFRKK